MINPEKDLELCEAATDGPWECFDYYYVMKGNIVIADCECQQINPGLPLKENAKFIAEARTKWPECIKAYQAQQREIERLKQLHHDIYEVYAGSDSIENEDDRSKASYLLMLVKKMAELAAEGKS